MLFALIFQASDLCAQFLFLTLQACQLLLQGVYAVAQFFHLLVAAGNVFLRFIQQAGFTSQFLGKSGNFLVFIHQDRGSLQLG